MRKGRSESPCKNNCFDKAGKTRTTTHRTGLCDCCRSSYRYHSALGWEHMLYRQAQLEVWEHRMDRLVMMYRKNHAVKKAS